MRETNLNMCINVLWHKGSVHVGLLITAQSTECIKELTALKVLWTGGFKAL